MDTSNLSGLDSFPYRHRVSEVMGSPVASIDQGASLAEAVKRMYEEGISSLLTLFPDGKAHGIITEKDVLRAVAIHGAEAGTHTVGEYASSPVAFVRHRSFVYKALGRMARLNVRHLVVIDDAELPIGMITARALLKLRAAESLQLGDQLAGAESAADMAAVRAQLPTLAEHLFAEGVDAVSIAAVISSVYCDMTRRATELAVALMPTPAPAPWVMLVLGSGGRGESLLAPDQDNAIVYDGPAELDPWFAEVAGHATRLLDEAGVPLCKGEVMATNPVWRKSLEGWAEQIRAWVGKPDPQSLLMVDIFYDFLPVYGDATLSHKLRAIATDGAKRSLSFLQLLGHQMESLNPPLGVWGQLKTENGRIDLKKGGTLPLVRGSRVIALQQGVAATSTRDRLTGALEAGAITLRDKAALFDAQEILCQVILRQQIDDIRIGKPPTTWVDPKRFNTLEKQRVKSAVKVCDGLKMMVKDSQSRMKIG